MRIVIENCDVTAGHVGDMYFVTVFDQSDQSAAHADHIVIGMRAEADHTLGYAAAGMVLDRLHHPFENAMSELGRWAMFTEQRNELMMTKVVVIQLEQRFARLLTQPKYGSLN